MGIVRWDPFRDLVSLQDKMNELFDESLGHSRAGTTDKLISGMWNPAVDIYETDDQVVLKVEVPGLKQSNIKIELTDNTLTLRGERTFEKDVKEENYHCIERSYGNFIRSFNLPVSIQQDKINASLKDGLLEIRLPKAENIKLKEIEIKAED